MLADKPQERLELALEGMTCASCAARIERKLNKLDGVKATVNFATERAAVAYDPDAVDVERLIRAVEQTGYGASLPQAGAQAAEPETDALFRRLVCAVVLTGPLTVLSMVSAAHFTHWRWLAFALATPVVLWAGEQFHRAALVNARHLAATMDTLVSVGTIAAWLWSTVVLFGGLRADV